MDNKDENLEASENVIGEQELDETERKTAIELADEEAKKEAEKQKLSASEVYAEESYQLQAEKAEEIFEATAEEVAPPVEESEAVIDEKEKKQIEKSLLLKHFGTSLGNMSIVFIAYMLILISGQLILGVGTILIGMALGAVLFALSVATLGIIYLVADVGKWWGYIGKMFEGGTDIINFLSKFYVTFPYVIAGSLLFSIVSIITTAKSGKFKSVGRIVVSSIMCGISAVLLIFLIAGGLNAK